MYPLLGEDMIKSPSSVSMARNTSANELLNGNEHRGNTHFMKKIPHGAEASNILVGEVDFLQRTMSAFIRLNEGTIMGDLTEVPVPTRYFYEMNTHVYLQPFMKMFKFAGSYSFCLVRLEAMEVSMKLVVQWRL